MRGTRNIAGDPPTGGCRRCAERAGSGGPADGWVPMLRGTRKIPGDPRQGGCGSDARTAEPERRRESVSRVDAHHAPAPVRLTTSTPRLGVRPRAGTVSAAAPTSAYVRLPEHPAADRTGRPNRPRHRCRPHFGRSWRPNRPRHACRPDFGRSWRPNRPRDACRAHFGRSWRPNRARHGCRPHFGRAKANTTGCSPTRTYGHVGGAAVGVRAAAGTPPPIGLTRR